MDRARYFDNAATTPLDPRVLTRMLPFLDQEFGNANSLHTAGRAAREAVDQARGEVALLFGAEDPSQIIFTSGATEGANAVIAAHDRGWISPFEHAAIREPALGKGFTIGSGEGLACMMRVNNETGLVLQPPANALVDATQSFGKEGWAVGDAAFAVGSAHKIYGPMGVGALYVRDVAFRPLLLGGGQEDGRRAGTLNVAGIVGFGEAARLARADWEDDRGRAEECRAAVLEELTEPGGWGPIVNGAGVPHILSLAFSMIEAEMLLIEVDRAGYAISAGAACSSRSGELSPVLLALGMEAEAIRGTVRVSFGRFSTVAEARNLGAILGRAEKHIRSIPAKSRGFGESRGILKKK